MAGPYEKRSTNLGPIYLQYEFRATAPQIKQIDRADRREATFDVLHASDGLTPPLVVWLVHVEAVVDGPRTWPFSYTSPVPVG